jgi:hypothetical protein
MDLSGALGAVVVRCARGFSPGSPPVASRCSVARRPTPPARSPRAGCRNCLTPSTLPCILGMTTGRVHIIWWRATEQKS